MSESIQNLAKPKSKYSLYCYNFNVYSSLNLLILFPILDAFEQLEEEEGTRQGFCHIRIQQRTGRKTITTVQGIAPEYDLKKIVRYLKKVCFIL